MNVFKFSVEEQQRLVAAFRATRKTRNQPDPTITECLLIADYAEQIVGLCAGVEAALRGEMMIDWANGRLELSIPIEGGPPAILYLRPLNMRELAGGTETIN